MTASEMAWNKRAETNALALKRTNIRPNVPILDLDFNKEANSYSKTKNNSKFKSNKSKNQKQANTRVAVNRKKKNPILKRDNSEVKINPIGEDSKVDNMESEEFESMPNLSSAREGGSVNELDQEISNLRRELNARQRIEDGVEDNGPVETEEALIPYSAG